MLVRRRGLVGRAGMEIWDRVSSPFADSNFKGISHSKGNLGPNCSGCISRCCRNSMIEFSNIAYNIFSKQNPIYFNNLILIAFDRKSPQKIHHFSCPHISIFHIFQIYFMFPFLIYPIFPPNFYYLFILDRSQPSTIPFILNDSNSSFLFFCFLHKPFPSLGRL
jgi:hypothetical protein